MSIPIPSDKSSSSSSTSSPSKDATRNRAPSIDEVDSNQGRSYDSKPSSLKHTNLNSPGTTPTGGGSTSEQGSGGRPPRHALTRNTVAVPCQPCLAATKTCSPESVRLSDPRRRSSPPRHQGPPSVPSPSRTACGVARSTGWLERASRKWMR